MTAPSRHIWTLPPDKKFALIRDGLVLFVVFCFWALGGITLDWWLHLGNDVTCVYRQWGKNHAVISQTTDSLYDQQSPWMPGTEMYVENDKTIDFFWGEKNKQEWPFGKYDPYVCGTVENPQCQNRFAGTWTGRVHLASLPKETKWVVFQVISDGSEVQFGRITKSGMRDRYIARPPLLPGQKCTELDLPNSPDARDQQPCPQECQPLPYKESQLSHMSHQVQNIDQSPPLWLGDTPPGNHSCDRWVGTADYLDFELNYTSTGIWPNLQLRWSGDGFPFQVVEQKYLYELDHMNMGDHFKTWDLRPQAVTVIGVCIMLAVMWFVGEVLFITKKAKDGEIAKQEKDHIAKENLTKTRDYAQLPSELPPGAGGDAQDVAEGIYTDIPEGLRMATRDPDTYPLEWKKTVVQWKNHKALATQASASAAFLRGCLMYVGFFLVGMVIVAFFLEMAPPPPTDQETHAAMESPDFYFNPFGDMSKYAAYDFICFGALLLENLLFLWAILEVEWPTKSSRSAALSVLSKSEVETMQTGEGQQVCLLLACHCCDESIEKREGLTEALHAALEVFPPTSIFICDNARSDAPPDDTWRLVDDIWHDYNRNADEMSTRKDEPLNYIYLPVGNKTIAFFWVCDVWIPMLERNNLCPKFDYILMTDDDVCLPPGIQFPLKMMEMEKDVMAIAYAISAIDLNQAATNPRVYTENLLVSFQNLEYLLAGFFKQLQSSYGTTLACHGAIALWKRDILVHKIFWEHDCIFNGEDLQMGLILHAMKRGYKIRTQPRELVYTAPPDFTMMLWQQRVKSWDVTSHRMTFKFLYILLFQWCGGIASLVLKPFFVLEVFNIFQDWARIFFLFYLLTYYEGQWHLIQWVIFLVAVEWIMLYIWNHKCLTLRKDLMNPPLIYFLYPLVYKPLTQVFRWYALLENIVRYSPFGPQPFKVRERHDMKLLPPPPLFAASCPQKVDWRSIWCAKVDESTLVHDQGKAPLMYQGGGIMV